MSRQVDIYRDKYLKYKTKYLELQNKLNNLSGGGLDNAINLFFNKLFKHKTELYDLFRKDAALMDKLRENKIILPVLFGKNIDDLKLNNVLNKVFTTIIKDIDEDIVEEYLNIYLSGQLGIQKNENTIKYKSEYIEAYKNIKKLRDNKFKVPATFDSLSELETYIIANATNLDAIDKQNEGKDDVVKILETDKLTIYRPTSKAGLKYYGDYASWYLDEQDDNIRKMYIIVPKVPKMTDVVLQLQFESGKLIDGFSKPVIPGNLSYWLKDESFDDWFNSKLGLEDKISMGVLRIDKMIPIFTTRHSNLIKALTFGDDFNQPLGKSLDNLTGLIQLKFGHSFDQYLDNSLDNLTSLRKLTFGNNFNNGWGPLKDSLAKLTNLVQLDLGGFHKMLEFSLFNLTNLMELKLGDMFVAPLSKSLCKQTNLRKLTFGSSFNQYLGDSLNELTSLQELNFGSSFNQGLYDSLNKLTSLTRLNLGTYFNQPLGSSLDQLTNLQQLTLSRNFNTHLGSSLDKLTSLQQLTFGDYFNRNLDSSLDKLSNLQQLTFGDYFNQLLYSSLDKLTSLQQLTFGRGFNQHLGSSLDKLIMLRELNFGDDFNNGDDYYEGAEPLANSFDSLTNLQQLNIGGFRQPVDNSLDRLVNLQQLTVSRTYSHPLPQIKDLKIIKSP